MIAYIKGELAATDVDTVVVEAGGLGYEIYVPVSVYEGLPAVGAQVRLHTYLHVREGGIQLFGFLDRDSLEVFKLLITVSGIGPKGALGVLSVISPNELRFAILADDAKTISRAPGIGAKTARKLILELKDKLHPEDVFGRQLGSTESSAAAGANIASEEAGATDAMNRIRREAVAALEALGYSATESLQAVRRVELQEDMDTEELLKRALKEMLR
ncbi:MAG: Holliday junction branch migration protein RuvA [Lachnospiraceae bacterium]|jgi:Holliday junction DNA helicase RuvA|nr:Holliday junction branch migration protein RuvA [Lachnospiraceae bacterium]